MSGGALAAQTGHDPTHLGELTLANDPCDTFAEFWARRRILPLAERCHELHPLADGHEERIGLWQLEIILVHVALFGEAYARQAIGLARRYV